MVRACGQYYFCLSFCIDSMTGQNPRNSTTVGNAAFCVIKSKTNDTARFHDNDLIEPLLLLRDNRATRANNAERLMGRCNPPFFVEGCEDKNDMDDLATRMNKMYRHTLRRLMCRQICAGRIPLNGNNFGRDYILYICCSLLTSSISHRRK